MKAAVADVCSGSKDFHKMLSAFNGRFTEKDVYDVAKLLGADMPSFIMCLGSADSAAIVKKDYYEGKALGVNSVPAVFVNGKRIDLKKLKEMIKNNNYKGDGNGN